MAVITNSAARVPPTTPAIGNEEDGWIGVGEREDVDVLTGTTANADCFISELYWEKGKHFWYL